MDISNIFTKLRNKNTKVVIHKRQNQEGINLVTCKAARRWDLGRILVDG